MKRIRLKWPALYLGVLASGVLAFAGPTWAQESLSKDIVGKWAGSIITRGGNPSPVEVEFKPDGVLSGGSKSARFGLVPFEGTWKVDGSTVLVDYTTLGATEKLQVSWTLNQDGDGLTGRGTRKADNYRYDVTLKRTK